MKKCNCFAGLSKEFSTWNKSEIAIYPVPYDGTSTWIKGADKGPFAIIEASPALELYDIETDYEVYTHGIYTCPFPDAGKGPEKMVKRVENGVSKLLNAGKFVVTIGGEHSVSIGAVRAHAARFESLSILQLDAHADLRNEYEGSPYNHACVMARIKETCPCIVQAGLRSMSICERKVLDFKNVFFAKDILNNSGWISDVVERLSDNVYVTIDVDVLDPSIMPSTGTPEPGGLTWYQVMNLLRETVRKKKIAGFDVTELCPNKTNKAPDFTAAKLIYKFLSYIYSNQVRQKTERVACSEGL